MDKLYIKDFEVFAYHGVFPEEKTQEILISESWLGRVVNGLGEPLDAKGRLTGNDVLPPQAPSINPLTRRSVNQPLDVGVKAINGLLTIGKGQRVGLMAGSGVGKSVLLGMITRQTKADIVVVGLIGERGREVKEFIDHALGAEGLAKSIVVAAPADESPLMRLKATELCHSIAAWFRDRGHHVLLLVDSLTRYAMAQREIALSLGEPPATKGYPPSAFGMIPKLVESAGNSVSEGSMTAIYTVLAEGDDQQDPIVDCARAVLDGHIVLTRKLAEAGHYPAIDIGQSISRCMTQVTPQAHQQSARLLKQNYAAYMEIKPLIPLGGVILLLVLAGRDLGTGLVIGAGRVEEIQRRIAVGLRRLLHRGRQARGVRVELIVGIHKLQIFAARALDGGVARAGNAGVFLVDDDNAGVEPRVHPADFQARVAGTVVDEQHFQVFIALAFDAFQARNHVHGGIVDGHDDGDERAFHTRETSDTLFD